MSAAIAERVAAGAAFLNENDPGWWREDVPNAIDLRTLNLGSGCNCVLGQREGGGTVRAFSLRAERLGLREHEAAALGFEAAALGGPLAKASAGYRALTQEWRKVIIDLRCQAKEGDAAALLAEVGAGLAQYGGAR
jgi:hypothetical protein